MKPTRSKWFALFFALMLIISAVLYRHHIHTADHHEDTRTWLKSKSKQTE